MVASRYTTVFWPKLIPLTPHSIAPGCIQTPALSILTRYRSKRADLELQEPPFRSLAAAPITWPPSIHMVGQYDLVETWQPTASKQVCEHDLKLPGLLDPLDHLLSVSQNQLNEVSARNRGIEGTRHVSET